MTEYPHLKHAPITEALIDIRIKPIEDAGEEVIQKLNDAEIDGYPEKQEMRIQGIGIEFPVIETKTQNTYNGHRFISPDNKEVFQARMNGFTFSRLEPYLDWENLISSAKKLWASYLELLGDVQIIRIAVRYINRIDVPEGTSLDDYFVALPSIPEKLPDGLISFLSRAAVPFDEENATALITQSMSEVKKDVATIIFDIDVFRVGDYSNTSEDLWVDMEKLRHIKNLVFFESLTAKAIDNYRD